MNHTPGPWRVDRQNPSPTTGEWMVAGAKPGYLAEVRDCGSGDVQANANLIAAAPDLLAALEMYRKAGIGNSTDFGLQAKSANMARTALAKAKGEV